MCVVFFLIIMMYIIVVIQKREIIKNDFKISFKTYGPGKINDGFRFIINSTAVGIEFVFKELIQWK